eukprot:2711994-Karenia_brevis.AAC.1
MACKRPSVHMLFVHSPGKKRHFVTVLDSESDQHAKIVKDIGKQLEKDNLSAAACKALKAKLLN